MQIRLQKIIADSGLCSRRKAEELIESGKVKLNGKVVTRLGTKAEETDKIEVNGVLVTQPSKKITIALFKPEGYITSKSDPHHSQTIMDLLPKELSYLKPAGRLDKDSEGLLILSSDGELIQRLTHPSAGHTKTYMVRVKGFPKPQNLAPLSSGKLKLDGYLLNPMEFHILSVKDGKTWIRLRLTEGRNRQIRKVLDSLGYPVIYLKRTEIGKLQLGNMKKGEYKELSEKDISLCFKT
ncbi:rRNA pseudouridine synthase [Patescibacteria group bacterium]|nr:rRNA pseudouridine synthase [Patescibacteria group bacterium]